MAHNILSPRHLPVLAGFAASNVLLAFDYDGTLAPIAPTPAAARMRTETRRWLARAARRYPCVVISGRPLDDLAKRLRRIPVWHLFGNHGLEPLGRGELQAPRVREWVSVLRSRLPRAEGLVIEDKTYSATVHYRHAQGKRRLRSLILDAARHLPDARAVHGAEAINLLPRGGPHKGVALQQARRLFACDTAIYVGDDGTDEDAFASAPADRLLAIAVGMRRESRARFRLRSQQEVDRLLQTLVELRGIRLRPGSPGAARGPGRHNPREP